MASNKKWFSLVLTLSIVGSLLAGCGGNNNAAPSTNNKPANNTPTETVEPKQGEPVKGGTLTIGSFSDIVSVNPLFVQDTASGDAEQFLFAKLYNLDPGANVVVEPWSLAAELPEISEDGLTYTIKLKDNAKWSDGEAINADDVVFTMETTRNKDVGAPGITGYDKVSKIEKLDDLTVKITLTELYAPFQFVLVTELVPEHVLKDVAPKALKENTFGTDPAQTVYSGPWKWTEWKKGQYLTFDTNENYWAAKPNIEKVVYKIYADQNTEVQALIKGDVDHVSAIPVTQVDAVTGKNGISVILEPGPQYEFVSFNFKKENFDGGFIPWTGQKTRQAIAYAMNRQGMIDNVLKGTGKLVNAPFLPGSWADPGDAAVNYEYSADKAKALLAEDGWVAGKDGILERDGKRFSFELQYNAGNSRREQIATVIQSNLKDVGIEVKPRAIEFSAWVEQNLTPGKFNAILLGWSLSNPDPDSETIFSSKFFPPNGQNQGWYVNETLDALWQKGTSTIDIEERKAVYKEVGKEISTDLPYIFMYQYGTPIGMSSKIKFAEADAPVPTLPYGYYYNVQNWWLE